MTETRGKDFNFFATVDGYTSVPDGYSSDGYAFSANPQVTTGFRGARRMMFVGVSGTNVEYSFNGTTVHGRISAGQIFNFGPRDEDKVFVRGSGTIDVHIWHIGT